ncbi:MAG TPA: hypothetical protein VHL11_15870, partial [Phototrophicaceae bacterium]|nr:hypothetical protein [Phototrophicaceae bacterium]
MMLIQDKFIVGFVGLLASVLFLCGLTTLDAQPQRLQDLTPTPCDLVNKEEKMLVFFAPIFHESQLKDILPQNVPYSIIGDASAYGYYQIEYEQGEQGWIEFHTMISNGDCPYAPSVDLNYSDFPSVCFYTITEPLGIYSDVELTKLDYEVDSADLPITYPIVSWTDQVIERMPDYSPGRFIEANHGTFSGHCEGTLQLATVLENARVWSEPDVTVGQVITSLEAGTEVGIIDGPVSGKLLTDSDLSGNWYKITWG